MTRGMIAPRTERASGGQLFASVLLFILGTSWLFLPGSNMGRDAWIAALMAVLSGTLLLALYLRLGTLFPQETPAQWLPRLCGPLLGRLITWIFALYFLYLCARSLRDVAELLRLSFLARTPVLVITLIQATTVSLAAYYGLEVSGRVKQLLLPLVLILLGLTCVGLWAKRYPLHLYPMLEYGLKPVWTKSFPTITTIPYGELVVYLTLLPYVRGPRVRWTLFAYASGGLIMVLITFLGVLVIGPANMANAALPYYTLVRSLALGDVIQRLDGVVVPLLACGVYAKATTFMLGASYLMAQLLGAKRPGTLAPALGFVASAWATTMATSWAQHLAIGLVVVPYALHIPMQLVLPLLLWLLAEARQRLRPIAREAPPLTRDTPPAWPKIVTLVVGIAMWSLTAFPSFLERSLATHVLLKPLAQWVGEPVVRLLGGHPMSP